MSTDITARKRALKFGSSARPSQQFFHAWKYVFSTACAALGGQGAEPVDLFAGLADRRVRRSERPPLPREHRPPVVQQIPQGAGGVGLVVRLWPGVTPVI
jgi:hypothetical protein